MFHQKKAWCPKYFEQWQWENQTLYEPLIWSFRDVNYCLQHNCRLLGHCPHCDAQQKAFNNNSRLGYCDRCQQWLGNELNKKVEITEKEH